MVIGHEQLQTSFEMLVREGTLGHAYLFYGDAEIGKASFALHLAHYIERGTFDLPEGTLIDSAVFSPNEKGTLGIDDIRTLRRFLWQTPMSSSRRIAIIDGAHTLTSEAQGAMLKIVEEPPAHGLVILIAHDPQVIIAPLLSRVSKIYFPRMSKDTLVAFLMQHKNCSSERAKNIAGMAYGRVGRAIRLCVKTQEQPESLTRAVEGRILSLAEKGIIQNSSKLAWLLAREASLMEYNVNTPLQKKAVEYKG